MVGRHGWGADESLRFDTSGHEIWPRDTHPVRGLVLHHTKTPNGEPDTRARLHAIYDLHAVGRGWGDIGYHLVIDGDGVVHEGRAGTAQMLDGGPAVIAGHVYGRNHGNVGIALLGTLFDHPPTSAAWASLVLVMAWLSYQHDLDPLDTDGGRGGTIRAHRDLTDTTCPGQACYDLLPALRVEVATAAEHVAGRAGAAAR